MRVCAEYYYMKRPSCLVETSSLKENRAASLQLLHIELKCMYLSDSIVYLLKIENLLPANHSWQYKLDLSLFMQAGVLYRSFLHVSQYFAI